MIEQGIRDKLEQRELVRYNALTDSVQNARHMKETGKSLFPPNAPTFAEEINDEIARGGKQCYYCERGYCREHQQRQ
jgi:hypothetical protein